MSSEDFKSLIVTDPDLIDEGIDVSGLRTQTNTNPRLLGAIEDYPGISYDPTAYSYLSDLNRLYASGLPETDTSQPTTPAPPSGGGGGGGGTSPGTGGTTPTQPDSIGGFNPGVTPGPSGFIGLDPEYDVSPFEYDDYGTYEPKTYQGTPGGNTGSGYFDLIDNSGKDFGPYSSSMPSMLDQTGRMGATTPPSTFGTPVDVEQGFTQDFSAPGTLADPLEKMDFVSGADVDNPKGFLDKLGLKGFDPAEALIKTAINAAVGKPVTFFLDILTDLMPPMDPRTKALREFYNVDDIGRVAEGELMAGYNPVSGSDLLNKMTFGLVPEKKFGLQDAYQDRIDTIENTLANKYKMTAAEIADVKAGNYTGDVDTELFDRLNQLEEAKEKEKARLDLFSGDVDPSGEGTGDASIAEQIAQANKLGISGDIGVEGEDTDRFGGGADILDTTGVGEFGGTPITTNITSDQIDEFGFDTPTGINTGIKLGPRRLDQDLSTLGDDLSAELDDILGNNITGDSTLVAGSVKENIKNDYQNKLDTLNSLKEKDADLGLPPGQYDDAIKELEDAIEKIKLEEIEGQTSGLITMTDAIDTSDDKPQGPGPSGFVGLDEDMDVDPFEFDDMNYEPPTPPSPPTGTDRPGGDSRDDSPAPSAPSAPDASGTEGEDQDRFGGGADYSNVSTGGPPSQSGGGGGGGGGGGCFLADTLITMADGSTKEVQKVDLGDNVAEGGKVFATGKFLVENLHDYKGIKVSGSHMVNEDDNWVRVKDSKHGKPLGDDEHTVYVFGSENRRILINGILFTDYFETTEQEKLINDEKNFFNNWKTYENKINQDNINILNAS
jgi:hypothetical protein